jgi:hypothetical protein
MKRLAMVSVILASLVSLQGCAWIKTNPDMITIESDPSGATVYAMGKDIGVTPLDIRQRDVFPPTYSPEQQPLYGIVTIRHAGCKDYTQRVDIAAYRTGIMAKLECGEQKPASEQKPAEVPRAEQRDEKPSIEKRLQLLKELQDKGLVTEDEVKATRRRILEGL